MRVTQGGFLVFTGGKGSEVSGLVISGLDRGADNGKVSTGGDILVSGCDGVRSTKILIELVVQSSKTYFS